MEAHLVFLQFWFFSAPPGNFAPIPHMQAPSTPYALTLQQAAVPWPLSGLQLCVCQQHGLPRGDSPQGRSLCVQALEGAEGHLGRRVLCLWYGAHGPKGKMCELGGCILMKPHGLLPHRSGYS